MSLGHAKQRSSIPLSDGGGVRLFLARQKLVEKQEWQDMLQGGDGAAQVEQLARKGNNKAMLAWGKMLLGGHGVTQDKRAAFNWFEQAAKQNFAPAINLLGRCYERGWGIMHDMKAAFDCYQHAAALDDMWALFNLADCYRKGVGCDADETRAFALYERAAIKGHVKSLNMLGLCYEEGRGVRQDTAKAASYFTQAAIKGDCWACFNHARFLNAKGAHEEALYWLEQSLRHQVGDYCQTVGAIFAASPDANLRDFAKRAQKMTAKNSVKDQS